ncbi:MFS transporter [Methylobacterium oryzae CBMB20]
MEGFWAVGYVLSGAISFFVLPYLGWRWAFVVVGLLSLVVLAVRRTMPESPRWLAEAGRTAEAESAMAAMERGVERATGRPLPRSRRPWPRRPRRRPRRSMPGPRLGAVADSVRARIPPAHRDGVRAVVLRADRLLRPQFLDRRAAQGARLLDRRLGGLRHPDHPRRHPGLRRGGRAAGAGRPQAHHGPVPDLRGGGGGLPVRQGRRRDGP